MARARYKEQRAPRQLDQWVEGVWSVETPRERVVGYGVPPDGCLDIIYSAGEGIRAVGAMTVERQFDFAANSCLFGVRFRPGLAGRFLQASPAELTDKILSLEDLWGAEARQLRQQLDDLTAGEQRFTLILDALVKRTAAPNPVQRAIHAITLMAGNVDLEFVARQANLSPRQFRRRCLEESGLTPKHLCRVLRFQQACRLAESLPRRDWSRIAVDAGFFDQAHLISDFREFTGRTPVSFFSNTPQR